MPYNNTPITPAKEITGTVSLPLARVKKIIATDDDISNCSNNAAFVITVAAEMFLQHLVDQSYNIVKSERKPRRNIQYRDVANAVARVENLEFLTDVVPKTTIYRQFKQKQANAPAPAQQEGAPMVNGQSTLDTHMSNAGAEKLPSRHPLADEEGHISANPDWKQDPYGMEIDTSQPGPNMSNGAESMPQPHERHSLADQAAQRPADPGFPPAQHQMAPIQDRPQWG